MLATAVTIDQLFADPEVKSGLARGRTYSWRDYLIDFNPPPIPTRAHDWRASLDGHEEDGMLTAPSLPALVEEIIRDLRDRAEEDGARVQRRHLAGLLGVLREVTDQPRESSIAARAQAAELALIRIALALVRYEVAAGTVHHPAESAAAQVAS